MLSLEHLRRLRKILDKNDTVVPIVVEGQKLVVVRPRGIALLDRIRVQDIRNAPGDRIEMLIDGVLPLPTLGNGSWPRKTMSEVLELIREAAGEPRF